MVFLRERLHAWYTRYERRLSSMAFLLGFLWDSLTLTNIDSLFSALILLAYLLIAFSSILILNAHGAGGFQHPVWQRGISFVRFLLPFSFGGLMSAFLIFYSRSGSVLSSAPFFIVLILLFWGNELFRKQYERFTFQVSVFFTVLFSYLSLIVPVLLREIGDRVFLLSGLLSLILFSLMLNILRRVTPLEFGKSRRILLPVVAMIYITFNFLYFNNMIPPIPLSLKEIGVYHEVQKLADGGYFLRYEKPPRYAFWRRTSSVFHKASGGTVGDSAFVFSSIYAPTNLSTEIVHRWSRFDEAEKKWVTATVIQFPIFGGRLEGFRGYSQKENLIPGRWRVDVETVRGQVIGRIKFKVVSSEPMPALRSALL